MSGFKEKIAKLNPFAKKEEQLPKKARAIVIVKRTKNKVIIEVPITKDQPEIDSETRVIEY